MKTQAVELRICPTHGPLDLDDLVERKCGTCGGFKVTTTADLAVEIPCPTCQATGIEWFCSRCNSKTKLVPYEPEASGRRAVRKYGDALEQLAIERELDQHPHHVAYKPPDEARDG